MHILRSIWRQQIRGLRVAVLLEPHGDSTKFAPINKHVLGAARRFGEEVVGVALDQNTANACSTLPLSKIVYCETQMDTRLAENACNALVEVDKHVNPDYWISAHSPFGKNILPRLSALLTIPCISDITSVHDKGQVLERPIYAGNALARVKCDAPKKAITIRGTSFEPEDPKQEKTTVEALKISSGSDDRVEFVSVEKSDQKARPDLGSARVIISGGRAFKTKEDFDKHLNALADVIPGSAIGASRAAVDSGLAPNDLQIGQTGKVVAPALYIAVGISGAIQHVAGMKDSKVIVSINKDGDCPINSIADYSLVGDLYTILPELTAKIAKL